MSSTINVQDFTCDICRPTEQEEQSLFRFVFFAPSFGGDGFYDLRINISIGGWQDCAECQSVDGDVWSKCNSQSFGHGCEGSFANGVREVVSSGAKGAPIENVDNPCALHGTCVRLLCKRLAQQKRRGQVNSDMLLPIFQRSIFEG